MALLMERGNLQHFRGGLRLGLKVFGHSHFKMYLRHKSEEFKWELVIIAESSLTGRSKNMNGLKNKILNFLTVPIFTSMLF